MKWSRKVNHVQLRLPPLSTYRNPRKEAHPQKYVHPSFLNEVVAKGAFLSKVRSPIYAAVHAVMLSKKHRRSSSSKKAGVHHWCYCVSKSMTKRGIAKTLHAQLTRATCEVSVFLRAISQLSKIHPPPSFRSHLSSSPTGVFSRNYGTRL